MKPEFSFGLDFHFCKRSVKWGGTLAAPRLPPPVELPQPVQLSFANLIVCASVDCDCDCALACTSSKWLCAPAPASACGSACRWFSVARVAAAAAAVTDWQQFSFALFFGRIFPAFHSFNWKRPSPGKGPSTEPGTSPMMSANCYCWLEAAVENFCRHWK